ncbi:oxidoreductase [Streptomyces spiroverticillatus]|uniref:Oxidoreductase n=1 Tax=Streptomyces finlayi TaxID=67296 RepID=A0A919CE29_9ACTN|nr:aldo/keto reductase [Streptomyces finlayi]GHA32590.1 oxidoreductase [Streptomyces spiroverticillatus]GHD10470.1 oxidoreductase [Streptomyces finlayi]
MPQTLHPAAAAGTWTLGGELTVNRLGYGTMRLPQIGPALNTASAPRDRAEAVALLHRALDLGVNHFDTAAFYFSSAHSSNDLLRAAFSPYADDLTITTKVWPARNPDGSWWYAEPHQLRDQVEDNLRALGRDHLDVVNLRIPRSRTTGSIAEHFSALAELREAGLIRHLGLSNVTTAHLAEARAIAPVVCVQNPYGLEATPEETAVLRTCGEQGIAFVPFYAIAGAGRETGTTGTDDDRVLTVARAHDASPAQIRLAWTLHQGPHVLAIPGTGDPAHLAANVEAAALRLTDEDLALLNPA